jgi:hypothetical protein
MEEGRSVLVVGASSFLGANLVPFLRSKQWHVDSVSTHKGERVPYDKLSRYRCVVYLKPDAEPLLNDCPVPLVAIGSGALVDFNAGRIPENPYIEGKRKIVAMASCTIHPGFFIPDARHVDTGRGLHRETLMTLFSPKATIPETFSLDKAYYMTPVQRLLELLERFVQRPNMYRGEFAFGTPMPISRRELLHKANSADAMYVYAKEMCVTAETFDVEICDDTPANLAADAAAWVGQILKN